MTEADRRAALDPLTEALRFAHQADVFMKRAADAERRGEAEWARDHLIDALAWEMQGDVIMERGRCV